MNITFHKYYISDSLKVYFADQTDMYSIIYTDGRYYIRRKNESGASNWDYVEWFGAVDGFNRFSDAVSFINSKDWETATLRHVEDDTKSISKKHVDVKDALLAIGFVQSNDRFYGELPVYTTTVESDDHIVTITVLDYDDDISVLYNVDGKRIPDSKAPKTSNDIGKTLKAIDRFLAKYDMEIFAFTELDAAHSAVIMAVSTRELSQKLMRVKSSNVWAYYLNVKNYGDNTGDLLVQFKAREGGPGDIYIYYDVPIRVFHRWQSAPSKGHYFWQYIRNVYMYHKLTGNKRGVLPNAIN